MSPNGLFCGYYIQKTQCSVTLMDLLAGTDKKGLLFTGFTFGEGVVTQGMLDEVLF